MSDNNQKISIEIEADAAGVTKGAEQAVGAIAEVVDAVNQTGKSADESNTAVKKLTEKFFELKNALSNIVSGGFNTFLDHAQHGLYVLAARTAIWGLEAKEAFSLEKQFTDANRMFDGTGDSIENLNRDLKDLATNSLDMPIEDVIHLAKVAGGMGKAADEVKGFVLTSAKAALSFNMPAEEMMGKLGGIQSAIKLTDDQLGEFTDKVKIAADSIGGMTTEADIMGVLADGVAQAGQEIGLLSGETIAFSSVLLSTGSNVSNASNSLFNLFFSLKNVTGQSKEFKDTFAALGLPIEDFAQGIKTAPIDAINQLLAKLKSLSGESKIAAIKGIVGGNTTQQAALLNLVNNFDVLQKQLKSTSDAPLYAGKVDEAYQKKLETTSAKIQLMKNALSIMAAAFINPFLPAIKLGIDAITHFADFLRRSSENHPFLEILLKTVQIFLSLGGVIHLISLAWIPFVAVIGFATSGFLRLAPIVLSTTAYLGGLIASTWAAVTAQTALITSSGGLSIAFTRLVAGAKLFKTAFMFLVGGTAGLMGIAVTALAVSFLYVKDNIVKVGDTSATVSETISAAWSVLTQPIVDLANAFIDWLLPSVDKSGEKIKQVGSTSETVFSKIKSAIYDWGNGLIGFFDLVFGTLTYRLGVTAAKVVAVFNDLKNLDFNFTQSGAIDVNQATMDYLKDHVGRDYLGEFSKAVESKLKAGQAKPTTSPAETRPVDNGESIVLADKTTADKQKSIAKKVLDAKLDNLKTEQDALKSAHDLNLKQLELAFNQNELSLKQQGLQEQDFNARVAQLKQDSANKKLAIEKDFIIKSAALEKAAILEKIKAAQQDITPADHAMAFFQAQGWSKEQSAGIASNLQAESQFNPKAAGDGGAAFGVGQWHQDRQADFAKAFNKPIQNASLQEQLQFVQLELTHTEADAGKRLRGATSATQAGGIVSQFYERPKAVDEAKTNRGSAAEALLSSGSDSFEKLKALDAELLAHENETNDKLKALGLDAQQAQVDSDSSKLELSRSALEQDLALQDQGYSQARDASLADLALKQQQAQFELDSEQITQADYLAKQREFAQAKLDIELAFLNQKRALLEQSQQLGNNETLALKQNLGEIAALKQRYALDVQGIGQGEQKDKKDQFKEYFAPLGNAIDRAVDGVLTGQQTIKNAMKNMAQSVLLSYAQMFIKQRVMAARQWLWEVSGFAGVEAKKKVIEKAGFIAKSLLWAKEKAIQGAHWLWEVLGFSGKESAKTGIATVGTLSRTSKEEAGVLAKIGLWIAEALGFTTIEAEKTAVATASNATQIAENVVLAISYAGVAGAAGTASAAAIPIVGWTIAPAAGAMDFAAAMGFATLASAKGGEYEVKKDGQLYKLHEQEMVLPAHFATPLRNFIKSSQGKSWGLPDWATTMPQKSQDSATAMAGQARARQANDTMALFKAHQATAPSNQVVNHYAGDTYHVQATDVNSFNKMLKRSGDTIVGIGKHGMKNHRVPRTA